MIEFLKDTWVFWIGLCVYILLLTTLNFQISQEQAEQRKVEQEGQQFCAPHAYLGRLTYQGKTYIGCLSSPEEGSLKLEGK